MATPYKERPEILLGIRYRGPNSAPAGLKWRKVKAGDTLGTIADEYPSLTWADLARLNRWSIRPGVINYYLYHYVGCRKANASGNWYVFSDSDNPGMILVPASAAPKSVAGGRTVRVSRGETTRSSTQFAISVVERLPGGSNYEVFGKWLYVFSGPGLDFGYDPPMSRIPVYIGEGAPRGSKKPGSAFDRNFSGTYPIKNKPDRLEHEILITAQGKASPRFLKAVSGKAVAAQPQYRIGGHWHFLSKPAVLAKATSAARGTRKNHRFRSDKSVTLDLAPGGKERRYYFLLSPVQLGPAAIRQAMSQPKSLTPFLVPGTNAGQWNAKTGTGPSLAQLKGPAPAQVRGLAKIQVAVIDPYSWVEHLANSAWPRDMINYSTWLQSERSGTLKYLRKRTGWTLDHYYVAQLLKAVLNGHKKAKDIRSEIKDPNWEKTLRTWEEVFVRKNAQLTARAYESLQEILDWFEGPAHKVIETALIQDTSRGTNQDRMDVAWGIIHWAVTTRNLMALESGALALAQRYEDRNSVPYQAVFQHFERLGEPSFAVPKLTEAQKTAIRYAHREALQLLTMRDLTLKKPKIPSAIAASNKSYTQKLADYMANRRKNLIATCNRNRLLPVDLKAAPVSPPSGSSVMVWALLAQSLDVSDKGIQYVIDPDIKIPTGRNRLLDFLANMEKRYDQFAKRYPRVQWLPLGLTYTAKSGAIMVNALNLVNAINAVRFDYQNSASYADVAGASSGFTLAAQDALAELGPLLARFEATKKAGTWIGARFVQQYQTSGGPAQGVGIPQITNRFAWGFSRLNALAMIVSGAVTVYCSAKGTVKAAAQGDVTAAAFYGVSVLGGTAMVAGGVIYGLALMKIGGVFSATGVGVSVGIVIFVIGALVAGVATAIAVWCTSDDFEVFARKCFLGKQGNQEPRWKSILNPTHFPDPPEWSHARKAYLNSWPVKSQRRAILNLLGRFHLKTKLHGKFQRGVVYRSDVHLEISPGLLIPDSTMEVTLHHEKGRQTSATFRIAAGPPSAQRPEPFKSSKGGGLFEPHLSRAHFFGKDSVANLSFRAARLNYDGNAGSLLTTVTLRYPGEPNTIRCRKLVMEHGTVYGVTVHKDAETAKLFE